MKERTPRRELNKKAVLVAAALLVVLGLTGCGDGAEEQASQTPTATKPTTPGTQTPEASIPPEPTERPLDFSNIPIAPEDLSGEESLADLMEYLDRQGGELESSDFILREAAGIPGEPRIHFSIEVHDEGGWLPDEREKFGNKKEAIAEGLIELRNLSRQDVCRYFIFHIPLGNLLRLRGDDWRLICTEDGQK